MNFKSKKWTVILLILLIILSIGVFLRFSLSPDFFEGDVRSGFLTAFSQNPFRKQSQVNLSLVDSKLALNFDLVDEDKPGLAGFVNNLYGKNMEVRSLSVGLDEKLVGILAPVLPVNLNLKISGNSLEFKSQVVPSLQNALIKNDFEFATGSGTILVKYTDNTKYQVKINDPADLLNYATASGKLVVSSKVEGLFKTLSKVATIELNVNGKNISGKIVLK